jgi:hypothetical protein
MSKVTSHIAMVGGLAYREALATVPGEFTATLKPEPGNPYNPKALAVHAASGKIGYVSPEIARHCYEQVAEAGQVTCPARKAGRTGVSTGVEVLLDLTALLSGRGV